ncbi:MAG: PEP-utilizing enzyme, partial [Acidimicrobiia bacterium]
SRPLAGTGVGHAAYRGRARVARHPEEAIERLEPGDVLVTPTTTPAFNAVLAIAGALVVEEGGLVSHAAITARELGLPAVVGVPGALAAISDGDEVEVDPVAGRVSVVAAAGARPGDG